MYTGLDFVGLSDSAKNSLADVVRKADSHNRTVVEAGKTTSHPAYTDYVRKWEDYRKSLASLDERANSTLSWVWESEIEGAAKDYDLMVLEWANVPLRIGAATQQEQIRVLQDIVDERGGGHSVVPNLPISNAGPSEGGFAADARRAAQQAAASATGVQAIPDIDLNSAVVMGIKLAKWGLVGVVLLKVYEAAPGIISRIRKW